MSEKMTEWDEALIKHKIREDPRKPVREAEEQVAAAVQEAIDTCPVMCISYVDHEDLVILETERAGQFINNAQRPRSQQEATAFVPPTAASGR